MDQNQLLRMILRPMVEFQGVCQITDEPNLTDASSTSGIIVLSKTMTTDVSAEVNDFDLDIIV